MRRKTRRAYSGSCAIWSRSAVRLRLSFATVAAGNLNAVDICFQNAVESADGLLDFGRRDVLALPAKSVADAVDEVEIAVLVLAHQITSSEPAVAFFEHVVQDLFVGLRLAGIALEPLARLRCILEDLADDLARLIDIALDTESALVPHWLLRLRIKA